MPNEFQNFHVVMSALLNTTFLTSFLSMSLQSQGSCEGEALDTFT